MVTRLRAGLPMNCGSIPGTDKKMCKNIPEGKRSVGKPRKRWLDDVENDLKKMVVIRGWGKIARDRDAGKLIQKETKILHGP